jgi:cell division protein FtsB
MKALEVAMNIGVMLAVSAAIKLVTWGIDQLIHRSENLRKKQSELYDSYKENKDSLDEINNELKTNVERMKELQGLSDPTYVENITNIFKNINRRILQRVLLSLLTIR